MITEVTVRLLPPPESVRTLLAYFPTTEATTEAVSGIIESGIVPSTLELMDQSFLSAVAEVYGLELPKGAAAGLLIELDGPESALGRQEEAAFLGNELGAVENPSACCGGGGFTGLKNPSLSAGIGAEKIDRIEKCGADTVVAGCPGCLAQIRDMLSRRKSAVGALHPLELLAASYKEI